jgi:K+-sensing histidine kinase KdpD
MGKSCTAYVFRNKKPFLFNQKIFDRLVENNEVELVGSFSPSWIGIPLQTPSKMIGVLVLQHYEKENVYSESEVKFLVSIGSQIALSIERKKSEEEIKLKNELLQVTNSEKDKFFSIIAHDLRSPLSAFVAVTEILTEEIQTMDIDEIKEITLNMKTSATNIYTMLENLLEWSRLRRDGLEFVPVKLNLKEKIEACIDVLSEYARKKKIETKISVSDKLEVYADNHMFDTVIRNLVSNAIKFTHVGGNVSVSADYKSDHSILVKISDSGIGISPQLKSKLFQLSEKTNRNGTEGEASTGLGLLLCKEFI